MGFLDVGGNLTHALRSLERLRHVFCRGGVDFRRGYRFPVGFHFAICCCNSVNRAGV